ncbi:MAG: M20 family metallopeptidase [Planctomycetaceae bacterium]|nr:M20 family metallopeptidase [Planctomycetaceae bacterium]
MPLDLVPTLADLISIPSVNPMGRDLDGPEYLEYKVTDYLEQRFKELGLRYKRYHVSPKRENILIRVDGDLPTPEQGGPLVLLEAHQDTVPVEGMTIPPWTPTQKDGRIYGRGSCDIKGGLTAMLGAMVRLKEEQPKKRPTVVLACVVNEEFGFTGATALTQLWTENLRDELVPKRPDVCVVAEPTSLDVVVAHKGTMRWRIHTHGRAAHSSQPHLGDNAVYKMARVLLNLERYAKEVCPTLGSHPLVGQATLSVGLIHGGISVNTVPDRATIELCRRVLPNEKAPEARQKIIDWLNAQEDLKPLLPSIEQEPAFISGFSLSDEKNGALADRLAEVSKRITGRGRKIGVPYGTDASRIAAADVPSVVFGPGSIDQAHTCDEWLPLQELPQAAEVLYEFARSWN